MNSSTAESTTDRECCAEAKCESGLRNNYYVGKRLTVDSFRVEQKYLLERRQLLNRAIHGWGVVYGYAIKAGSTPGAGRLEIGAGLALDKWGRELLQTQTTIEVNDMIIFGPDEKSVRIYPDIARAKADLPKLRKGEVCWLLSAHYAERKTAPVSVEGSCQCEHNEWDHTCETVRYSLRPVWCAECCHDFECELGCECGTGPCCDKSTDSHNARVDMPRTRGGCRCLCEHLTQLVPGAECSSLCEIEESCARVRVDLRNGVPLACFKLVQDGNYWKFDGAVEACGPRRLVKRNDLLFDLIRGCDLTRISKISWADWHRKQEPILFNFFSNALGYLEKKYKPQEENVPHEFSIEFSRPVRGNTLGPDCFTMTVMTVEGEGGWWQTYRVPIVRVDTGGTDSLVHRATIVFDEAWVKDAVRGWRTIFQRSETRVEIEVRGDFIIDCNGQTIDANAVGHSPFPTGNGTPGGTFLSSFRVAQAPPHLREYAVEPQTGALL